MPIDINFVGVLAAAIINMVIGFLWYSPVFFGKPWMRLLGIDPQSMQAGEGKKKAAWAYAWSFVCALITSYVLAHFVVLLGAISFSAAFSLGFWLWLGFTATAMATQYLFSIPPKPWGAYFIDAGYQLVAIISMTYLLVLFY